MVMRHYSDFAQQHATYMPSTLKLRGCDFEGLGSVGSRIHLHFHLHFHLHSTQSVVCLII
jgi:hypothetical protein